jgi:hypothetical protein
MIRCEIEEESERYSCNKCACRTLRDNVYVCTTDGLACESGLVYFCNEDSPTSEKSTTQTASDDSTVTTLKYEA